MESTEDKCTYTNADAAITISTGVLNRPEEPPSNFTKEFVQFIMGGWVRVDDRGLYVQIEDDKKYVELQDLVCNSNAELEVLEDYRASIRKISKKAHEKYLRRHDEHKKIEDVVTPPNTPVSAREAPREPTREAPTSPRLPRGVRVDPHGYNGFPPGRARSPRRHKRFGFL